MSLEKVIWMTIDDFIYENSIVRDNGSEYTADHIDRVIESVCNNYGLTIKMISTNYVFPRIIKSEWRKGFDLGSNILEIVQSVFSVFHRFKCYSKEDNCVWWEFCTAENIDSIHH